MAASRSGRQGKVGTSAAGLEYGIAMTATSLALLIGAAEYAAVVEQVLASALDKVTVILGK